MIEIPHDKVEELCKKWKIKELALFGSALGSDFTDASDIDLLVEMQDPLSIGLHELFDLEEDFTALFGRRVDLVFRPTILRSENYIRRDDILGSAFTLYAA